MRKKSDVILPVIAVLLVAVIGSGIWVLLGSRQPQTPPLDAPEQAKILTMSEVAQHDSKADCWAIISKDVYDLTEFINRHPGGDEILRACGTDATTLFNSRQTDNGQSVGSGAPHSKAANEQLAKLKIGTLSSEE